MADKNESLIAWLSEGICCNEEYGFSGNVLAAMKIALEALTRDEAEERREWMARGVDVVAEATGKLKTDDEFMDKINSIIHQICTKVSVKIRSGEIICD